MPLPPLVYCAVYTRVSARDDREPACSSCARQREACMQFIFQHRHLGWMPLTLPFDDNGKSGASLDRPALNRLLDAIANGSVQRVVVHRFDRLTRSVSDFARLQALLKRQGVGLSVVHGEFSEPSNALGQFQMNVLATFAQFEREIIAERLRDAREAKRERGLRIAGLVPFGYSTDRRTKQLVAHPAQAETIRWMFSHAAAGMTPAEIATLANSAGDRNRHGRVEQWSTETVLGILRNPVYAGRISDGRRGVHAALVDAGLFERVNEAIGTRRTREPTPRPERGVDPFLLRGLLSCWRCGHAMTTSSSRKIAEPGPRYYRCRRRGCMGAQVPALAVETHVVNALGAPPENLDPTARAAFTSVAEMWELLTPANRRRMLVELLRSIRLDSRGSFEYLVNEETAAELAQDAGAA